MCLTVLGMGDGEVRDEQGRQATTLLRPVLQGGRETADHHVGGNKFQKSRESKAGG